jgi:acyl transferase domain-containing protein/acyl carrier protein
VTTPIEVTPVSEEKLRYFLKRVTADLHDARRRLQEVERSRSEPIAIVAMSCRFPGGVRSPEDLWELVLGGVDAISDFPRDRHWADDLYHPDPDHLGTSYTRSAGSVHDVTDFDPDFFGISPREALAMDPQQRLLLETSWEVLERAGITPTSLHGSQTGVFVGAAPSGYGFGVGLPPLPSDIEGHLSTGNAASIMSGRVSYLLGLHGPAVTVDTACSSSLVAIHLAAQALRAGECSLALAGGTTVNATPAVFVWSSRQRGLAADGRSKAFGAAADGMGMGEGAGMLLLERLSDACRNGHQVLAVLRGSAMNQDGASNGLTAPSVSAQEQVIRAALASAQLSAADVQAVEAHGSGTSLGDPIEAAALLATYGQNRPASRPLWLGSVKSNIGHTQAAAGVAGVVKMVMALRHGILPPTLHAGEPSPHVDWSSGDVRLLTAPVPWEHDGRPRRAGVSAFGMSGTNVHAILEEPGIEEPGEAESAEPLLPGTTLWMVSARSEAALRAQAARVRDFVVSRPGIDPADVAWSLAATRSLFEYRAVVLGENRADLTAGLAALASGASTPAVLPGIAGDLGKTVFVFPGQGAQWAGMGRELLTCCPVFAGRLAECGAALAPLVDWSLTDVLLGADGAPGLGTAEVVQPVLWAVMVSLAAVWEAAGVRPQAVVGHSQGEIAAATVAGALSVEDAARVVVVRSRALSGLGVDGAMVSVVMPEQRVRELMAPWGDRLAVAAVNGPAATVVSGEPAALTEFEAVLAAERAMRWRVPETDFVAHAPGVAGLEDVLAAGLAQVQPRPAKVAVYSTALSRWVDGAELDAAYWFANVRNTVRFADAVRALDADGYHAFIEVSPHPTLEAAVADTIEAAGSTVPPAISGTTHQESSGAAQILGVLGRAFARGVAVDWAKVLGAGGRVDLPTYPFQRRRLWPQPGAAEGNGAQGADADFWAAVEAGDLRALGGTLAASRQRPFGEMLPALAEWRRRAHDRSTADGWRYRVSWAPVDDPEPAGLSGTWLVVTPAPGGLTGGGLTGAIVRALAGRGAGVTVIDGDTDRAALAARLAPARDGVTGVVSLLALDETALPDRPEVPVGLARTLSLVQALGDSGIDAPLWLLTRGAVATGAGEALTNPVQAQVWGLGRVAAQEHPDRWGGLVDVPAALDDQVAARLCRVLAGRGEQEVAVRAAGVFGRRLVHAPPRRDGESWRPRGTVLITGGTGAIAGHIARRLASRGAERIVLTGRSGPAAPGVATTVADLAGRGTAIDVLACDAGQRAGTAAVVAGIRAAGPPLSAVVHTAGVLDDGLLDGLDAGRLATALTAKATGAAILDELTAEDDLDAFVLFSSAAAVFGGAGQGNYAAANAYLDALAERRAAGGRAALSIAWGPWAGGGVAEANDAVRQRMRRGLLPEMDPQLAVLTLDGAVVDGDSTLAVMNIDWDQMMAFSTAAQPGIVCDLPEVMERIAAEVADPAAPGGRPAGGELANKLAGAAQGERDQILTDLVRAEAASVLGHSSPEAIGAGRAFSDLGLDSLTTLEMRQRLSTITGLRLPATVLFDYPTPAQLAAHLRDELVGDDAPAEAPIPTAVAAAGPGEPIAVVAMSCRYPGDVRSPEQLWELLEAGGEGLSPFPSDRGWDVERLFDPDPDRTGTMYVREGGFLHDAAEFDPAFFEISPREALAMDPQQRLLLETTWEVLERAGLDPNSLRGSRTGVFVGGYSSGYGVQLALQGGQELEGHLGTGNATSVLSGRLSYVLGLEGPAVTVDTACSSSLVTLHLACQALRSGECSMALAGGITVMATPADFVVMSRQRGLSVDGRCKAFSAAADGMGIAEGVGLLMLERLSEARRNGHPVLAVVRGSAITQDGASNGLTAPNGRSQERAIRGALANAGLAAADVDAVEAHGTGTSLGDPIEVGALLATYGKNRLAGHPLWLGSVKSNIGHAQAAAGVAGLIKMVLSLRAERLPRTLHVDEPSPFVDWSAGDIRLLSKPVDWPSGERIRRAGVSAFGLSGTNAHVILEEAPPPDAAEPPAPAAPLVSGVVPWVLSARSGAALLDQQERLRYFVSARPGLDPVDVAWSLATTRSPFEHRAVSFCPDDVVSGTVPLAGVGRIAWVFPGADPLGTVAQGGGPGRELLSSCPVFAARLAECDQALQPLIGRSVEDTLTTSGDMTSAEVQWAVAVSLAAVWEAAGVRPDAVTGSGLGEIAAASVAGVLSLQDAARVVVAHGRAGSSTTEAGFRSELAGLVAAEAAVPLISAVSGRRLRGSEADAGHWYENLRPSAGFDSAVRELAEAGHEVFLEISAHPVLTEVVARIAAGTGVARPFVSGTLRRNDCGPARLVTSLAEAWTRGVPVDWPAVLGRGRRVDLPTYAFQRQRYWPEGASLFRPPTSDGTPVAPATTAAAADGEARFWAAVEDNDQRSLAAILELDDRGGLDGLLPALASWRRRENDRSAIDGWRYRVIWATVADPDPELAELFGTWLVVLPTHESGRAAEILHALAANGAEAITVEADGIGDRQALAERIAVRLAELDEPVMGVLSLLALDETPLPGHPAVPTGTAGTQALVQALGDVQVAAPLWVLTSGAVSAAGEALTNPAQAQAWGMGRAVVLEHPDRWGGLVDLPPDLDDDAATRLCGVLAGSGEDQVAIRPAGILARRLARAGHPRRPDGSWTPRGAALVTGGTGAIGTHVAHWLAGRGAPRVVLTSRAGPGRPGIARVTADLAGAGSATAVVSWDAAERDAGADLLAWIERSGPPLTTVLHTAGIAQSTATQETTTTELAEVLAAKAAGATHLDELTAGLDLDAFVLFSSVAATWGSGWQPAYGAANAYLDAVAENRRGRGLPATSLAWGLWDGGGMSAGEGGEDVERRGLRFMDPALLVQALGLALDGDEVTMTVADVDWSRFAPTFTVWRPSPLLADLPEVRLALAEPGADGGGTGDPVAAAEFAARMASLPEPEQRELMVDTVRVTAAGVLGFPSPEAVDGGRAFIELGFNSLMTLELQNRLHAATGIRLPSTLVFEHPTPAALGAFLWAEWVADAPALASVLAEMDRLEMALSGAAPDDSTRELVATRLAGLLATWTGSSRPN